MVCGWVNFLHYPAIATVGTPVTNSVGDSRCHRAIIGTTDMVSIPIAVDNV